MRYDQGAIVIGTDPFGDGPKRPYLVVSNERQPFHDEEQVVAGVTTTEREGAVRLDPEDYVEGELPRQSSVSPWSVTTLKQYHVDKWVATVSLSIVEAVIEQMASYVEPVAE